MPIEDLAREDVVTAGPNTSLEELTALMDEEEVGSVVITEAETPVGIVTDRDITLRVVAEGRDPSTLTAGDVMTSDLQTVEEGTGFYEVADMMSDHGIRRVPVHDSDGNLAGIITADDLTELLAEEQEHLAEIVRAQRPEY